MVEQYT